MKCSSFLPIIFFVTKGIFYRGSFLTLKRVICSYFLVTNQPPSCQISFLFFFFQYSYYRQNDLGRSYQLMKKCSLKGIEISQINNFRLKRTGNTGARMSYTVAQRDTTLVLFKGTLWSSTHLSGTVMEVNPQITITSIVPGTLIMIIFLEKHMTSLIRSSISGIILIHINDTNAQSKFTSFQAKKN